MIGSFQPLSSGPMAHLGPIAQPRRADKSEDAQNDRAAALRRLR